MNARITRTGLSPAKARLSRRFRLSCIHHWPDPLSLATTSGVSVDVLSSGYLDVSVPRVCFLHLFIHCRIPLRVGFPIRKSTDQSLFAAPRSLSQRTTSFIASQHQGIHRMPLRHLIALIIDARLLGSRRIDLFRKDHLLLLRSFARSQAVKSANLSDMPVAGEAMMGIRTKPSLHDVIQHGQTIVADGWPDLDFADVLDGTGARNRASLVEPDGIEPTTSCLQSRRSPN